jgi:hypothetical protein
MKDKRLLRFELSKSNLEAYGYSEETIAKSMDLRKEVMKLHSKALQSHRESQIVEALKIHGFEFESKQDLEHFAKTRCMLNSFPKFRVLSVDGKAVCQWVDEVNLSAVDGKFTAEIGHFEIL